MYYMCKGEKLCGDEKNGKKIFFFDIDDTLYTHELGVPESTVKAIKKLRENGNLAFICTGRSKAMIFPFILDIGFDGVIAGAGTYAEYDGRILMRYDMEENQVAETVRKLRECGFMPVPEGHDYLYYEKQEYWDHKYEKVYKAFEQHISVAMREIPDNEHGMNAAKVSSVFTEKSDYEKAVKTFGRDYTVVNHGGQLLELIPKGFSKAEGIKRVIAELGISKGNTYALGDSMNDYEMLEFVEYGIAMGNSDERIIKIADYVTDRIENDGVSKALKHFGLI